MEAEGRSHRSYYSRMKRYLYDFWNLVDLLSYALLLSALFVRHFYIEETFTIARRMFALSLLVMYLRFLEVFLIHRTLGPTLIMIKEMVGTFFSCTQFLEDLNGIVKKSTLSNLIKCLFPPSLKTFLAFCPLLFLWY